MNQSQKQDQFQKDLAERRILSESIDILGLTSIASDCLKRANILTVGDLIKKSADDLCFGVPNFKQKSLGEIRDLLSRVSLTLRSESTLCEPEQGDADQNVRFNPETLNDALDALYRRLNYYTSELDELCESGNVYRIGNHPAEIEDRMLKIINVLLRPTF